jgi:hypothetical protein
MMMMFSHQHFNKSLQGLKVVVMTQFLPKGFHVIIDHHDSG